MVQSDIPQAEADCDHLRGEGAPVVTTEMIEAAMLPWCAGDPEFEPREDIVGRILAAGLSQMRPMPFGEK